MGPAMKCGRQRFSFLRVFFSVLGLWLVVALIPAPVPAQIDMGSVAGTVKDPGGAVVPGAQLKLINDATGVTQTTKSTSTGSYVFPEVLPGSYTLQAEFSGFKPPSSRALMCTFKTR